MTSSSPETNPEKIIEGAKALFRANGYSAVSMNDIVDKIGIKKPTIYHYFNDKEGLYTHVLIAMMAKGAAYIQPTLNKAMPFEEKLLKLAVGYFENTPTALATLLRDATVHLSDDNHRKVKAAMQNHMMAPFEAMFEEALAKGELSSSRTAQELALLFVTYLDTFTVIHHHQFGKSAGYAQIAKRLLHCMLHGINDSAD